MIRKRFFPLSSSGETHATLENGFFARVKYIHRVFTTYRTPTIPKINTTPRPLNVYQGGCISAFGTNQEPLICPKFGYGKLFNSFIK